MSISHVNLVANSLSEHSYQLIDYLI